ncbi:hypothetical protein [Bailinhaonella thermotolerans]|uniref:Uncharacterized protein n=1 Tax=Bailinhaonella thermotolerans TaxID=1070861 RepID=A0A3A4A851_9ACTN|nr:hypothetical protein [Bailinhaonella thermotolerans]RJL21240.1 hypothetical protein D5H75_37880 [Bailinhaonella thermotolerans]
MLRRHSLPGRLSAPAAPGALAGLRHVGFPVLVAGFAALALLFLTLFLVRGLILDGVAGPVYGEAARVHAGSRFTPGATAQFDGVTYQAVLLRGRQSVQVDDPPAQWRAEHPQARCAERRCVMDAPPITWGGVLSMGLTKVIMALGGGLLLAWLFWMVFVAED